MFDSPVTRVMREALVALPSMSVAAAARLMAEYRVGAVIVAQDGKLLGIFTERDLLTRIVAKGIDPETTPLSLVMTRHPIVVEPGAPLGYALVVMQERGFRHLPVTDGGKPIGIVSSRSAMDPDLLEFRSEVARRDHWKRAAKAATRQRAPGRS